MERIVSYRINSQYLHKYNSYLYFLSPRHLYNRSSQSFTNYGLRSQNFACDSFPTLRHIKCYKCIYDSPFLINGLYHFSSSTDTSLKQKENLKEKLSELEPESKVELTIKALKEEKKIKDAESITGKLLTDKYTDVQRNGKIPSESSQLVKPDSKDLKVIVTENLTTRIWKKIKHEVLHYYHGFRLLGLEIKISSKLFWQILNGHSLTRREKRQFLRTVSDLFRLIPFLVFIIVPFMEFLLPVALKLFPNMLPSTFNTDPSADKLQKQLKARLETAKFLQDTLRETALLHSDSKKTSENVNEFLEFMDKVRKGTKLPTNEEIRKFSVLFEDELTLDNLSREQLVGLCRLLQLKPIGTNYFLRFQLNMTLRVLKQDDIMIRKEGIDSLTVWELQNACRARGMKALGLSEARLKSQLSQWLELHLDANIPTSLLLLSRTLYIREAEPAESIEPSKTIDASAQVIRETIAALPKAAEEQAKLRAAEMEGARLDPKTLVEVIRKEEAAIREEKAEKAKEKKKEEAVKPKEPIPPSKMVEAIPKPSEEELVDRAPILLDKAEEILGSPRSALPLHKLDLDGPVKGEAERLVKEEVSTQELQNLAKAVESIAVAQDKEVMIGQAKELVKDMKEDLEEYKEDVKEAKQLVADVHPGEKVELKESKAATRILKSLNKILGETDEIVAKLEKDRSILEESMAQKGAAKGGKKGTETPSSTEAGDLAKQESKMVSITELVEVMKKLQKVPDEARLKTLASIFDEDRDGKVNLEHVLEAIEIIARENVKLDKNQIHDIITMLRKEDELEKDNEAEKLKEKGLPTPSSPSQDTHNR